MSVIAVPILLTTLFVFVFFFFFFCRYSHDRSEIRFLIIRLGANVASKRLVAIFRRDFVLSEKSWRFPRKSKIGYRPTNGEPAVRFLEMKLLAVLGALVIQCAATKSWNSDSKWKRLVRWSKSLSSLPVRLFRGDVLRVCLDRLPETFLSDCADAVWCSSLLYPGIATA